MENGLQILRLSFVLFCVTDESTLYILAVLVSMAIGGTIGLEMLGGLQCSRTAKRRGKNCERNCEATTACVFLGLMVVILFRLLTAISEAPIQQPPPDELAALYKTRGSIRQRESQPAAKRLGCRRVARAGVKVWRATQLGPLGLRMCP